MNSTIAARVTAFDRGYYQIVLERLRKMLERTRNRVRRTGKIDILDRARMNSGLNSISWIRNRLRWARESSEHQRLALERELGRMLSKPGINRWWETADQSATLYRVDFSSEVKQLYAGLNAEDLPFKNVDLFLPGPTESAPLPPPSAKDKTIEQSFDVVHRIDRLLTDKQREHAEVSLEELGFDQGEFDEFIASVQIAESPVSAP